MSSFHFTGPDGAEWLAMDNFFRSRDYGYCRMDNRTHILTAEEFSKRYPDFDFNNPDIGSAQSAEA